jgi:peptidyl-prolyl cis-trans isomerase C
MYHVKLVKTMMLAIICALLLTGTSLAEEKKPAADKVATDKAAVVNGTVITREEFNRVIEPIQQSMQAQGADKDPSKVSEIRKKVLENIIDQELLLQESKKSGIKVDDAKVDKQLADIKKRFPSETEFANQLKESKLTEADLRSQIQKGMSVQEFVEKQFISKIKVSDEETKAFYDANQDKFKQSEEVKASHILIVADTKADDAKKAEARKKIEDVEKRLKKGEDFAELAKNYSEDPGSKDRGGDLGFFSKGQEMPKSFEDKAFTLKPGEVSGIVETEFGFHIIKVTDKKPEGKKTYESVKDNLSKYMKDQKIRKEIDAYLAKVKETSKIERSL